MRNSVQPREIHNAHRKFEISGETKYTNKKIHRVLKFRQKHFLRKYMQLNSRLRKLAVNKFEKNQYKLFNNSTYGKALQNNRKHVDVRIATNWKQAERLISKPNFHRCVVMDDFLSLIQLNKTKVILKHPLYIGFTVLELAKLVVLEFHYDFMKKNFHANLCYTGKTFHFSKLCLLSV